MEKSVLVIVGRSIRCRLTGDTPDGPFPVEGSVFSADPGLRYTFCDRLIGRGGRVIGLQFYDPEVNWTEKRLVPSRLALDVSDAAQYFEYGLRVFFRGRDDEFASTCDAALVLMAYRSSGGELALELPYFEKVYADLVRAQEA